MRMIVAFEKTAQVRHLGHLDLLRSMQRALRRSGLPIRYSQGFNPHVVLSFASPLSVGMSGSDELLDVALDAEITEDAFSERFSPALPASLPLVSVRSIEDAHPKLMAQLKTAEYLAMLPVTDASKAMLSEIDVLLAKDEIIAIRKSKRGEKTCDIRPMLHSLEGELAGDALVLRFRTSLTELETLKPDLLLRTLATEAGCEPPDCRFHRVRLYGEVDQLPVPLMEI